MRNEKSYTAAVLRRYEREGRGKGTRSDYIPWHRIGRGDPSSSGRSHMQIWGGRNHELLSDVELAAFHFITMLPNVLDAREQFPLSPASSPHELIDYDVQAWLGDWAPGTMEIASSMGIKHHRLKDDTSSEPWRYSTDQLVLLQNEFSKRLLAIACKPSFSDLSRRDLQKLALEREYWKRRNVPWILITPGEYDHRVSVCLARTAAWALGDVAPRSHIAEAKRVAEGTQRESLEFTLRSLAARVGTMEAAQLAFWQAVWSGNIPLDLRRGWRPHLPITFCSLEVFKSFNPVWSRRCAWKS